MKDKFKLAFFSSFIFAIIGVVMKLNQIVGANFALGLTIIATTIYIVIGISEVNKSTKIRDSKKVLWTIGFICFNFITGCLYLVNRKG